MWRKLFIVLSTLAFAFGVLFVSVFRTASTKYQFNPTKPPDTSILGNNTSKVEYVLPNPGRVLPDSPLWPLKALRDKIWLFVNTNESRKAELKLLFADKRLGSAKVLFEKGKPEIGLSTLTKAEKYLEEASIKEKENREEGMDTSDFLIKVSNASLKHYELIQYILTLAPDNAKPSIIQVSKYPQKTYETSRNLLLDKGKTPPENPFNW